VSVLAKGFLHLYIVISSHPYLKLNNIDYKHILFNSCSVIVSHSPVHYSLLNIIKSLTIINNMVNQMTNMNTRGVLATLATLAYLFTTSTSRLSLLSPISLQSKFISKYSV